MKSGKFANYACNQEKILIREMTRVTKCNFEVAAPTNFSYRAPGEKLQANGFFDGILGFLQRNVNISTVHDTQSPFLFRVLPPKIGE